MLSRYAFEHKLSTGKFAKVYKAYDKQEKKHVAIKCMSKDRVNNYRKDEVNISNEASTLKKLQDCHIPKVFDCFEDYCECDKNCTHLYYIVMEFVDGIDIYELLGKENIDNLSEKRAAKYVKNIVDALSYCHSQNIIHRDIKMENIVINEKDDAILLDFGFAIELKENETTNIQCGTLGKNWLKRDLYYF